MTLLEYKNEPRNCICGHTFIEHNVWIHDPVLGSYLDHCVGKWSDAGALNGEIPCACPKYLKLPAICRCGHLQEEHRSACTNKTHADIYAFESGVYICLCQTYVTRKHKFDHLDATSFVPDEINNRIWSAPKISLWEQICKFFA